MSHQKTITDYGRVETAPTLPNVVDLVTLAEALNYLKQDYGTLTVEDNLVKDQIQAARKWIERWIGYSIIKKQIVAFTEDEMQYFPLPMGPVQSITDVKRIALDGSETTLTLNTDYYVVGLTDKALVTYPIYATSGLSAVGLKVTYLAYMTEVDQALKDACLALTAHLYFNRGDDTAIPLPVYEKLAPYRKITI